jgi:drug/metabolite transporter (DMT)-like permease
MSALGGSDIPERQVDNSILYAVSVLIWGSTWFAIRYQLGTVSPSVSVMWRFLAAGLLLLGYALLRRLPLRFTPKDHGWMALQGLFLFCLNYVGFYRAEEYLASGLVAIVFSLLAVGNILGLRLFFRVQIKMLNLFGVALGLMGLGLLFWRDLTEFSASNERSIGLMLAGAATVLACLGNMVATRNQGRRLPVLQVNGWSMLYGGLLLAIYLLATGQSLAFGWSAPYLWSFAYLTVFGSVLAFGAYLTLMSRVGADRAGYATIAIPVVALLISTWREDLRWTAPMSLGLIFCLVGNALVLQRRKVAVGT